MGSRHDIRQWFEGQFGIQFRHVTGDEYASTNGCPWCGAGDHKQSDRFHVWVEAGNYWCRQCGKSGFLDSLTGEKGDWGGMTEQERRLIKLEREMVEMRRKQEEHDRRLTALERMAHCKDHIAYHQLMTRSQREYWHAEGINDTSIDEYRLGFCDECPTDSLHRSSWTIPIFTSTGTLCNIRHRLVGEDKDKYRPHMAGLGTQLFNSRFVTEHPELVLVEGEKKAIVVSQEFGPAVGVMGAGNFQMDWLRYFDRVRKLYIALDPDMRAKAIELALAIKSKARHIDVRVASFHVKPDDLFLLGGTRQDFEHVLRWSRAV